MLERKDFITPTLNYVPYNDKPILTHWLIAFSYAIFGVSEFTSRLPSAFCASLLCVASFFIARRYLSLRAAWFAGLILISSYLFSILARVSLTDMPLALFVNLGMFAMFVYWKERSKMSLLLGWTALGVAFLTKGPISLLITFGSFFIFFLAKEKRFAPVQAIKNLSTFKSWKGIFIASAIAVPWFVAVGIATHGQYLKEFFWVQNLQRAAGTIPNNHAQPFWFYVPIIAVSFFPWSAFATFMLPIFSRWWRARTSESTRYAFLLYCAAICFTIFSGFSALAGKLPTYMVPLYPAAAILTAAALDTAIRLDRPKFLIAGCAITVFASLLAIPKLIHDLHANTNSEVSTIYWIFGAYATLASMLAISIVNQRFIKQTTHFLIIGCATLSALWVPFLFTQFYEYHQRDYAELLKKAISRKPESISEVWCSQPSASFYARRRIPNLQTYYDYAATLAFPGEHIVLYHDEFENFVAMAPIRKVLAVRGEWHLESVADPKQQLLNSYSCVQSANIHTNLTK